MPCFPLLTLRAKPAKVIESETCSETASSFASDFVPNEHSV